MSIQFRLPIDSLLSGNAVPLAGGSLYFYTTGTVTPLATYSDNGLTIPNANPVVLDSEGRHGPIYLQAADYKVVLKNSLGVQVGSTIDPLHGLIDVGTTSFNSFTSFPIATGYALGRVSAFGSTVALPANTYANGAAGVGATLTGNANGALTLSGVTPSATGSAMIMGEASASHNGIYTVTTVGDAGTPYVLTRAVYWNTSALATSGVYGISESGGTLANTRWAFTNPGITFGTTSINFTAFTKKNLYLDSNGNIAQLGWDFAGNSKPSFNGGVLFAAPVGDWAVTVDGSLAVAGLNNGLRIDGGSVAGDRALTVLTHNEANLSFEVRGDDTWTALGALQNALLVSYAPVAGTSMLQLKSTVNTQGAHIRFTATAGAEMSIGASSTGDTLSVRYATHGSDPAGGTVIATWTQAGGLQVGAAPTGGDKGAGTINVSGNVYQNGTAYTNPDYVLEHWATGKIEKYADKPGAENYRPKSIAQFRAYAKRYLHLPGLGQHSGVGLFDGGDAVLANLESAFIYIFELEERIKALASRLGKAGIA